MERPNAKPVSQDLDAAKPVSQDLEYAFSLFWGIGRVVQAHGFYTPYRRFKKAKFPTRDTKPTEEECRVALATILTSDDIPAELLHQLAFAIYPEATRFYNRRIKFEKVNQGHRDAVRDVTVAGAVQGFMRRGTSRDKACIVVAKQAGIGFERVRDIYQEQKAFLDARDKGTRADPGIRKRSDTRVR
jgi:hypothetical protein